MKVGDDARRRALITRLRAASRARWEEEEEEEEGRTDSGRLAAEGAFVLPPRRRYRTKFPATRPTEVLYVLCAPCTVNNRCQVLKDAHRTVRPIGQEGSFVPRNPIATPHFKLPPGHVFLRGAHECNFQRNPPVSNSLALGRRGLRTAGPRDNFSIQSPLSLLVSLHPSLVARPSPIHSPHFSISPQIPLCSPHIRPE